MSSRHEPSARRTVRDLGEAPPARLTSCDSQPHNPIRHLSSQYGLKTARDLTHPKTLFHQAWLGRSNPGSLLLSLKEVRRKPVRLARVVFDERLLEDAAIGRTAVEHRHARSELLEARLPEYLLCGAAFHRDHQLRALSQGWTQGRVFLISPRLIRSCDRVLLGGLT